MTGRGWRMEGSKTDAKIPLSRKLAKVEAESHAALEIDAEVTYIPDMHLAPP